MINVPESMEGSELLQILIQKGINFKLGAAPNLEIETCMFCNKTGYGHLYIECHGKNSSTPQRNGLFLCQRCGRSGNLYTIKQHFGLLSPDITSTSEWAADKKKIDPLPDIDACHTALMADAEALDYLVNIRGFSLDIIEKQQLGLTKHTFKETGNVRALVIPYLLNGNCIWAKYRTMPDATDLKKIPKAFSAPHGWDATLYNIEALQEGVKEITLVEGECNTIAGLDKGILDMCGVPGANVKKAEWIEKLNNVDKVYIFYDADKVGQKAAQELAYRIGIEKCWKIVLPTFMVTTEAGIERKGKDLNEWFTQGGGTAEGYLRLKEEAQLFDVEGVKNNVDALDEFEEELLERGASAKYSYPLFEDLARFEDGDIIQILGPEKQGKTTVGLNMMEYMVDTYHENGVIICLEMRRARLVRKWLCHKCGIEDNLPKNDCEKNALTQQFLDAIPRMKEIIANREGDLLFCYPNYETEEDIYKLIIDCVRRYGVKWIMIDNLQLICDTTLKGRNRTQHLSEISKRIAKIGKDYGCKIIVLLQPHRIADNKLATSDSVDGASQIAKDCDAMFVINRNKVGEISKEVFAQGGFIQTEGAFGPEMLVTAGLSRYSAGGSVTLYFNGATSTIHRLTDGKIAAMNAKANPNVGYERQLQALNVPLDNLRRAVESVEPIEPAVPDEGEIVI